MTSTGVEKVATATDSDAELAARYAARGIDPAALKLSGNVLDPAALKLSGNVLDPAALKLPVATLAHPAEVVRQVCADTSAVARKARSSHPPIRGTA